MSSFDVLGAFYAFYWQLNYRIQIQLVSVFCNLVLQGRLDDFQKFIHFGVEFWRGTLITNS